MCISSDYCLMELSTLAFIILGFSFSFCAIVVDSQDNVNVLAPPFVSPPPPHPPPPSPPPPPFSQSPPPPQTPSSPPPSPHPPPPSKPRTRRPTSPPHSKKNATSSSQSNNNLHNEAVNRDKHGGKTEQRENTFNAGKKIGLLFIGVAGVLQICVAGFLVFKRQQMLRIKERYETCS